MFSFITLLLVHSYFKNNQYENNNDCNSVDFLNVNPYI